MQGRSDAADGAEKAFKRVKRSSRNTRYARLSKEGAARDKAMQDGGHAASIGGARPALARHPGGRLTERDRL